MSTISPKPLNPRAIAFGRQMRAVMLEKDVSSRELGRRLANAHLSPQTARRTVMKYLAGQVLPSAERRAGIAEALDVEHERLAVDDDDEESDLFLTLYQALTAIARHGGSPRVGTS